MADGPNIKRRRDLAAALARVKPRDRVTLDDVALLWGVTKQRFVTVRNAMATFPDPVDTVSNVHFYSARRAIIAMQKHEMRADSLLASRAARADAILGRKRAESQSNIAAFSVNEMAAMSRMVAETEERERRQGKYIPATEVAAVVGDAFSEISDFCSRLSNEIDPHGLLTPEIRDRIDRGAHEALLRCHSTLKDMLTADVRAENPGTASGRARKPRARR